MPRFEHKHAPGARLPTQIRRVLEDHFQENEISKLEMLGGYIEIKMSTAHKGIKKQKNLEIDEQFRKRVEEAACDSERLHALLRALTQPQLRRLSEMLGLPTSSQLSNRELIRNIEGRIKATHRWSAIIDS